MSEIIIIIIGVSIVLFIGVTVLFVCKAINTFNNGLEEAAHMLEGLGKVYNSSADGCKEAIHEAGEGLNKAFDAYVPVLEQTTNVLNEAASKIASMKGTISIHFGENDNNNNSTNDVKFGNF